MLLCCCKNNHRFPLYLSSLFFQKIFITFIFFFFRIFLTTVFWILTRLSTLFIPILKRNKALSWFLGLVIFQLLRNLLKTIAKFRWLWLIVIFILLIYSIIRCRRYIMSWLNIFNIITFIIFITVVFLR